MTRTRALHAALVIAAFTAIAAIVTWPQALHFSSRATPHQDVFFNMWRLRWFAHALVTCGASVWDGNIFSPERGTLALSDAMFVEGIVAAPLLWAQVPPVLVHNLMLVGAMVLSGAAMYALALSLTGCRGGGLIAGVVFAFAPYRFEHYMHMELQWAMWAPLALLALHRLCDTGRLRYGIALGGCLALQMLSSIYYGIYLATLVSLASLLSLAADRRAALRPTMNGLVAGAVLAAVICAAYAVPYMRMREQVGERGVGEVVRFSASPANYLLATPDNRLYGGSAASGRLERRLFPGITPVLLTIIALLLRAPRRRAIIYVILLVVAFEMSLGFRGYIYSFLHDHISAYRGLRAAARLALFVLLFLGVLAAYGYKAIVQGLTKPWRMAVLAVCLTALIAEYAVAPMLAPFPNSPPPLYKFLALQPRGIVAEFPMPRPDALPGLEAEYQYLSTFHWMPLVNGYSGIYPGSYIARLDRMPGFPDETSVRQLRRDGVRYVVLHEMGYANFLGKDVRQVLTRIEQSGDFIQLGSFSDGNGDAWLYLLR